MNGGDAQRELGFPASSRDFTSDIAAIATKLSHVLSCLLNGGGSNKSKTGLS